MKIVELMEIMENGKTIKDITERVERTSSDYENTNTDLKRRYLIWNIDTFNIIASKVKGYKGSFGTGYPFYVLDKNLQGQIPIIAEQIRYNRKLVKDGEQIQKSIWLCESCLKKNYKNMPDLKKICRPCPNVIDTLKPRKIINRLPDLDMWLVCEDKHMEKAQKELTKLLNECGMKTSDIDPLLSIDEMSQISEMLKNGKLPKKFLPIDGHIIEYSKLEELINSVPNTLDNSKKQDINPYLPIEPMSYRKEWQRTDEAYNFIYDFLSAFTPYNFDKKLQQAVDNSRREITSKYTEDELFDFLLKSATQGNYWRFQTPELEKIFKEIR